MTNINISPYPHAPMTDAEVDAVIEEMRDQTMDDGPLDRAGWEEILAGVGYPGMYVKQILSRWFVPCTTCGKDATHLWANVGEDGTIGSMCGPGKFSPSCDDCTGEPSTFETPQVGVLRCPLDFDPEKGLRFDDHPAKVAEWLCDRSPDTLGLVLRAMDWGYAREILGIALKLFAQHVAKESLNEIVQTTFDEVLLDVLMDARGA